MRELALAMAERVFTVSGCRLAVEERAGSRDATAVVLHGLTGDRALLADVLDDTLARVGLRRLYVELPGHGASMAEPSLAGADEMVAALADLVTGLAGPRPLLVGHAYGAYLALGVLRDVACGGAMLICPVVEPDQGKRTRPPRRVLRRDPGLRFAGGEHEQATFEEAAVVQSEQVLDLYRRLVMPASHATDRTFVEALRRRYAMARPYMEALARCDAPVSIVCGHEDHWVGFEDASRLARALPNASLHVVAGCGPLLPLEEPARLRHLTGDWLARVALPA